MSEIANLSCALSEAETENERLRREVEELRLDKARLDWMESKQAHTWGETLYTVRYGQLCSNDSDCPNGYQAAREAIDAAMSKE